MSKRKAELSLISSDLPPYISVVEDDEFKIMGRIQLDDSRAPKWVTEGGELDVLDEEQQDVSIVLEALPGHGSVVHYGLMPLVDGTGGTLPFGLTLDSSTGEISGSIEHVMIPDAEVVTFLESDRPTWITSEKTWYYGEKEPVEIVISAESNTETELHYTVRKGNLPWGLAMSRDGTISGTTQETLFGAEDVFTQSAPRWLTPYGTIIESNEYDEVSFALNASASPDNPTSSLGYTLVKGHLPWGLTLDPSGLISGTHTEVMTPDHEPAEVFPKPRWVTSFGIIQRIRERGEVDIQFEASPEKGTTIQYRVVDGRLPWGISLTTSGKLSGTFDEIMYPELPDIVDENAPTINASRSVGSFERLASVNHNLDIDIYEGRGVARVYVEAYGRMPLGVQIVGQAITGTVDEDAEDGVYAFTVTVVDSADMRSSKMFEMAVY